MKRKYRSKVGIILDILQSIDYLEYNDGIALLTKIMYRANLSYDRLIQYLNELSSKGLITKSNDGYVLTRKGREFLENLLKVREFLRAFGFTL